MKGKIVSFMVCAFCAFSALAAVRTSNSPTRVQSTENSRTNQPTVTRTATTPRNISNRGASAKSTATRVARTGHNATNPRGAITTAAIGRSARSTLPRTATTRAAVAKVIQTNTFDEDYIKCYESYFSCMDQFCALGDEHYRRCLCSSKLNMVQSRENALTQASNQLQDFKNLNIDVILKTPEEVKSMLSATDGEKKLGGTHDNSASMKKLTTISDVLTKAKTNSLSTAGNLDIAGDINQVWSTTDFVSGTNIANLRGESLYNAVHSQCSELVLPTCQTMQTLNMVASAYGMYIENDCTTLLTALDKQAITTNVAIRETSREMTAARLENYNAHNSSAINECIAGVRADLTADTACGENYIHCLDITGLYIERATGNPIYSKNFYKLNDQISLSGNILTNSINAKLVTELNSKKQFAEHTLETCRDIADTVWEEYLRQAITEIYQGQQARIQQVKNECMDVVNKCYDEKTSQLHDYSNTDEQMLLGERLELSEQLCSEKLETCSNLYGGGPSGLQRLVTEMRNIVNQKIAQNCLGSLQDYAEKLCRPASGDITHSYPYGCRVYTPGDIRYADNTDCTYIQPATYTGTPIPPSLSCPGSPICNTTYNGPPMYACWANRTYTSCKYGYYLGMYDGKDKCLVCPTDDNWVCDGNTPPRKGGVDCGDYAGSLYQKMVVYAMQHCMRPSDYLMANAEIPTEILADVNTMMDSIRLDMATILAKECADMGGVWQSYSEETQSEQFIDFYNETNANVKWGFCHEP